MAREQAGLTTVQAAKALGVRRPAIWEMEHGKRQVKAGELAQFAELYHVSETWLLAIPGRRAKDNRATLAADVLAGMSEADLDRLGQAIRIVRQRRSPPSST